MRKTLLMILLAVTCIVANGQVYRNFIEGGKFAYNCNEYSVARYLFTEALRQIPKDSIIDQYEVQCRLRDTAWRGHDYDKAIAHGKEVWSVLTQIDPSNPYYMIEAKLFVAQYYALGNDSVNAVRLMDEVCKDALSIKLNWKDTCHMSDLCGMISAHIKDWNQAESAYNLSADIARRKLEPEDLYMALNLYGNALFHNNKREEALKIYQEQSDVCKKAFGEDSREYQWANYCIANCYAYMGRIDEGSKIYRDVIGWYRNKILTDMQSLTSMQREAYLGNMIELLQNAIPFGIEAKYNEDEFTALAYECLLLAKGLLLATEKSTETIIREKGTDDEIADLSKLYQLKSHLADLLANPGSDPKDVLNTYAQIKTIDVKLANACAQYGNNTTFAAVGYEQVRNSLKDGEVLLDFADFKPKSKPRQYVCYEIRRDRTYPTVHYVCNGAELDSLLLLENHRWGNLYSGESGTEMASIIGNPLSKIIKEAKTVYYVPSGIFHKLAIEAVPHGEQRLGNNHSFCRLSSARELTDKTTTNPSGSARLYGGLTYGDDIKPLARSLQEVEDISNTLTATMTPQTVTADKGTKESFMQQSCNAPDIIHLSTHGFYYTPADNNLPASLQGYNDAMSLSGLVMSRGSLSSRLGLLTADEVAQCNLSNTAIACLASCHSGQGEVTSEGLYGLQRAFKKAGVKSVIMNLWEASDIATECFMTNFYSDLVNGSKDRRKAFQFAQNVVRKKYPSPFYWAGFAMID